MVSQELDDFGQVYLGILLLHVVEVNFPFGAVKLASIPAE